MKKNNKIKLSLNKETISELGMENTRGGGLSIIGTCTTIKWYPHQNSKTCCLEDKITDEAACLREA